MTGPSRGRRRPSVLVLAVALAAAAVACSGGGKGTTGATKGASGDLAVEVASFDLAVGPPSRFIVGVLTPDHRVVGFGTVAMRFSFLGAGKAGSPQPVGAPMAATFLAIPGSTVPSPAPAEPRLATGDERGVYSVRQGFDRDGFWQVEVSARVEGRERRGTGAFSVADHHAVPAPGDAALATENLTLSSTDAPKAAVDSRAGTDGEVPDPELHRTTIAAALRARRPAVVVFATPVYCTSRFCGPVTDLVDDLAKTYGDRASFVHVEIWREFQNTVLNKAAADWLFRNGDLNEPWVFVIGSDGRITARFDNVVTRDELEPLVARLPVIGPAT